MNEETKIEEKVNTEINREIVEKLDVLLYKEGGKIIAECLTYKCKTHGFTPREATKNFKDLLINSVTGNILNGKEPFDDMNHKSEVLVNKLRKTYNDSRKLPIETKLNIPEKVKDTFPIIRQIRFRSIIRYK